MFLQLLAMDCQNTCLVMFGLFLLVSGVPWDSWSVGTACTWVPIHFGRATCWLHSLLVCVTPGRNCWVSTLLCLLLLICVLFSLCFLIPLPHHGHHASLSRCGSSYMIMAFICVSCRVCHIDHWRGDHSGLNGEHGEREFQFSLPSTITIHHQAAGLDLNFS